MIHGGAGSIRKPERFEASLRDIIADGAARLQSGASALDVVSHCVARLEDDPLYNAGRGSVLNAQGVVECDASIMDGSTLAAGAVAGVRGIKNPVLLARAVLEKSAHVLLIGDGAEMFAREHQLEREDPAYFITEHRVRQLARMKEKHATGLDHAGDDEKLGTVGAVSRDRGGNLAAATSTGGLVNKQWGRVGDSPIIGAGTFADNASCAVSCTGIGEDFLRTSLARTAAFFVEERGMPAQDAADEAIRYLTRKVKGVGGLILIDRDGQCARAFSTPDMLSATAEHGTIRVDPAPANTHRRG
jgi:beta-aspartyl-peptidase (threonine type)